MRAVTTEYTKALRPWDRDVRRDTQGRMILGDPGGCPDCGAVRAYIAENGKAVWYTTPRDCCADRVRRLRRNPAHMPMRRHRKDVDG